MATAIPKKAQFTLKASAPKGRRIRRVLPSLGNNPSSGYSMGDTMSFYLPGGVPNTVMDGQTAYLRFTLQLTTSASGGSVTGGSQTYAFDYTASSIIRRIDCYGPGGQLVSTTDRYSTLANALYDVSMSQSDMFGLSAMVGSSNLDHTAANNRKGYSMSISSTITSGNSDTSYFSFAIPILTPLFALSETYTPIYALNDDIKIDIVLDTQVNAFVIPSVTNVSSTTVKVYSPEFCVDYIELEPAVIDAMKTAYAGGDIVLHSTNYAVYETSIPDTTQGMYNAILPSKVMSAKGYFGVFRNLATTGVQAGYTQSSRLNPFLGALSTFNLNVGGLRVPQRPLTTAKANSIEEYAVELQKILHALWDTQYNGVLARDCFISATAPAVGDAPGTRGFLLGLNLDMLRGNSDHILSGMDLSKVSTYVEMNLTTAISGLCTVDSYIYHDMLLIVDQLGNLTSKF